MESLTNMATSAHPQGFIGGGSRKGVGVTQKFIDIKDIVENVVILHSGYACLVIEVTSSNFALLSKEEQDAKIFSYASLLNSLSFSIQILIQSKRIDISSYINLLDQAISKNPTATTNALEGAPNEQLLSYIRIYRDFVQELVKVNTVLDKKFYIVIPYSFLEKGIASTTAAVKQKGVGKGEVFIQDAKTALSTKANSVLSQLARLGLRAKILEKEELIKLFYTIYNEDLGEAGQTAADFGSPFVKTT